MARFERSREGKGRGSRSSSPRRESRDGSFKSFKDRRDSDRGPKRGSRGRRDFEMTEVTCSSCGSKCEVPFKPTSSKPVYCNDCFSRKSKGSSTRRSDADLDIINEKLNKIMKALKIKD